MMKRICILFLLLFSTAAVTAQMQAVRLTCEYRTNPKGIDMPHPRFFWQLVSSENSQYQTAYQLLVATSRKNLDNNRGDAFDSGKVKSDQNTHVVYRGKPLEPATGYFWKVKVWDKNGKASGWSDVATFSTGLFEEKEWKGARWIAWKPQNTWEKAWWKRKAVELQCTETYLPSYFGARMSIWERYHFHHEDPYDPAPLMRKDFEADKAIEQAKIFISGIGYYELYINGKRVGDHVLDPGWTNYKKTVLYVAHDVTSHLREGGNALGVMLGRGNYGLLAVDHWGFYRKDGYVGQPKLKCRVKIQYADGSEENIVSDLSWKVTGGPVLYDGPHMGELYDATREVDGWNRTGLDASDWDQVHPAPAPGGALKAQLCEPIRVVKKFQPVKVEKRGWVHWADAGTNMSGWIRLKVDAPKGTRIGIYYGENEDPRDHGQPGGYQQMAYIAKGEKGEVAECRFSYKGFRYVNIVGYPGELTPEDIEICQVNSDVQSVGRFVSSDPMLNELHKICRKSMISNLHSIPTDCPHREKNGWMGDAITGMEYGMANYDLAPLMTKFTRDMFDTQDEKGRMSTIAPDNNYTKGMSPLWSSACIHVPWYMYTYYGDTRLFEKYWDKMKLFTQGVWKYNGVEGKPGIFTDVLADWCSPHGNISEEGPEVYTTMNFYLVLKRLAKMAEILDKTKDAAAFETQAEKVRDAIYKYCFDEAELLFGGITPSAYRQGPNAMALQYGIVKPAHQQPVLEQLVRDITQKRDNHFYGGIFTGHALWELMPRSGHSKVAWDVVKTDTYPGYGYMLKNGATTVWEHWEDKASHIHHFMGFVDNFLYRYVAGINVEETVPGFREVMFTPNLTGQLQKAGARYQSIHGEVAIQWERRDDRQVDVHLVIPVNCSGKFFLPPGTAKVLKSGGEPLKTEENGRGRYLELASGEHMLVCHL